MPLKQASPRLPVIALNLSEAPDLVENNETGFLDPSGLEEVLLKLSMEPELCMFFAKRAIGIVAWRDVWTIVCDKMADRIKEVCGS